MSNYLPATDIKSAEIADLGLSMNMRQRIPRRYDASLKCLRELAQSKSEKVRLAAVMRMTEIYLRFDEGQERVAIAIARAEARKVEAETAKEESAGSTGSESAEDAARLFLAKLGTNTREVTTDDN